MMASRKGRHPFVAKSLQEVSIDAVVGQGGHSYRVDENWALAICFDEAPEGTEIKPIEKSDEAKLRDIARQNCPRHVIAAPFA